MRVSLSHVLGILFAVLLHSHPTVGQPRVDEGATLSSGTLNLVLANKNGFVVAADSRMSSTAPFACNGVPKLHCDNSQKLFRTSPKSAMVVAGFAVGGLKRGSPLNFAVAQTLRQHFGPCGNKVLEQSLRDGKFTVRCAEEIGGGPQGVFADAMWAGTTLNQALTAVASLYDTTSQPPPFVATFAGVNKDGTVVLCQKEFIGSWTPSGPLNAAIPRYVVSSCLPIHVVQGFEWKTAGIADVAEMILKGNYRGSDPVIERYYRTRNAEPNALNSMSLAEMAQLAHAILRETRRSTTLVGGPDQIGIFPVKGKSQLIMPPLPTQKQRAPRLWPRYGLLYSKDSLQGRGFRAGDEVFIENFDRPIHGVINQLFLASQFVGVTVILDDNYFVRSSFDSVTFKYAGHGKPFFADNTYRDCTVEIPEAMAPDGSEVFSHCRVAKVKQVSWDKDAVGQPKKWEKRNNQMVLQLR